MVSTSDIVVVICHGGYLTSALYIPFVEALRAKGLETHCPQLPTSDLTKLNVGDVNNPDYDREPPVGGYPKGEQDVEVILKILSTVINEQGKRVLMIGHSAGGWVATEASHPELQAKFRETKGLNGGIIGIFYIGALIVPVGESIASFSSPKDGDFVQPSWLQYHKYGGAGLCTLTDPVKYLFNDLEETEARKWASCLTAGASFDTKLTNNAYTSLPCAYLVLEGDAIMPKEYQEKMISLQTRTTEFTVYRCPAGHSPHLSWKEGLVDTIQDFIHKIEG